MDTQRTKLSEVVSNFLDSADLGDAEYSRAYRIALRGAREFKLDHAGNIQTTDLLLKGDCSADLPEDCVKLIRVGVTGDCYKNTVPLTSSGLNTAQPLRTGFWINEGEYKVVGNVILLNMEHCRGSVFIEYLSLDSEGNEHYIDVLFEEALIAFVRYQWFLTKKNNSGWDKQFYKKVYEDALNQARFRKKVPNLDKLRQSAYNTTKIR